MAQYPLVKTFLVAAWLEVYFSVDSGSVIFGTSVIMFIVATLHVAVNGYRVITGYVDFGTTPGGPVAFLGVISSCTQSRVFWVMQWQCTVAGSCGIEITVAGSTVTVLFANTDPTASIFDPRLTNWITVFFSTAVAQNIITTGLMALRLWQREKRSTQYRISRGGFIPILLILMESAALYLFVETLLLTLYEVNYNAQFIVLEAVTPVIGITFCMITVRISLRSQKSSSLSEGSRRDLPRTGSVELRRIAVNITKETEDDDNCEKMTPV
ncbi:hypothetical protein B0H14DRAFT_3611184 [Mycena olivaceomarginata]|nr:hypothetical protein B0H14DRAFT_3611184 [Mycena olivaceomarginata]